MDDSSRRKPSHRREPQSRRRSWCCSFAVPPSSPENLSAYNPKALHQKTDSLMKPTSNSVPNSPLSSKSGLGLGRIDPRRILSPGRVSPIDSDPTVGTVQEMESHPSPAVDSAAELRSQSFREPDERFGGEPEGLSGSEGNMFDVRLNLRGKRGGGLVLELNSEVLCMNSELFAGLIEEYRKGSVSSGSCGSRMCRIEVPEVENLAVFRETIELMFEDDITKRLLNIGVYRTINVLEVSAGIMFTKGVISCLKYLEAVPWTEEEEGKLRSLFSRFKFDDSTTRDILARLYMLDSTDTKPDLAKQLVWSITTCTDANARNELKTLFKGLLCKSSVYEKNHPELSKEDIYVICLSCLDSLVNLFKEASSTFSPEKPVMKETGKPLIERISRQVDNINWLLDILLDRQMAEEFVDIWADQGDLLRMHENASPMVRYEISRVTAFLVIAMGTRKLHCRSESRSGLLQAWFGPMLMDFGWLQRCRKGLDTKALEEAMGQTLLTLPLKLQYMLFMEWFRNFSKHGSECPNLSKAFQIWWRRSFLRGSETNAIESR
ncbi:BTB/POZ domain-containing protein At2g13690 isoform X2 [Ziziphus jujuba]|uniref:BTB/POZ domain-containing protein At2g13690 isoform X2 n=1 Tax=Ziziphus jujuba TaxID=326968 RepID=A0ABM3ISR0_ZIZJJ|nr:BTB/POZ domain-containing protein At2g13690 isoform X2 [Ziziphus jujuba]